MYFFDGELGAIERMMTKKPDYYRRSGNSDKSPAKKKLQPKPSKPEKKKKGVPTYERPEKTTNAD